MPLRDRLEQSRFRGLLWVSLVLGQRRRAEALVRRRLDRHPGDPHALATRAHLRLDAGDPAGAIAALEHLVAQAPQTAQAWFNLGFLHEAAGRIAQAEAAFRRATEIAPGLDQAWYGLGLCLIRLGRLDEAVQALHRNTALQPMNPFGWYQLAHVHLERQEPEEARRILRHLRRFEPRVAAQLERETGLGGAAA